jgi:hypothetical protein
MVSADLLKVPSPFIVSILKQRPEVDDMWAQVKRMDSAYCQLTKVSLTGRTKKDLRDLLVKHKYIKQCPRLSGQAIWATTKVAVWMVLVLGMGMGVYWYGQDVVKLLAGNRVETAKPTMPGDTVHVITCRSMIEELRSELRQNITNLNATLNQTLTKHNATFHAQLEQFQNASNESMKVVKTRVEESKAQADEWNKKLVAFVSENTLHVTQKTEELTLEVSSGLEKAKNEYEPVVKTLLENANEIKQTEKDLEKIKVQKGELLHFYDKMRPILVDAVAQVRMKTDWFLLFVYQVFGLGLVVYSGMWLFVRIKNRGTSEFEIPGFGVVPSHNVDRQRIKNLENEIVKLKRQVESRVCAVNWDGAWIHIPWPSLKFVIFIVFLALAYDFYVKVMYAFAQAVNFNYKTYLYDVASDAWFSVASSVAGFFGYRPRNDTF